MRIHHVAFRTRDVDRLVRFYSSVLGLGVRKHEPDRAWLTIGDAVLMIEKKDDREPDVAPDTKELVAFAVAEPEREAWLRKLEGAGVTIEASTAHTLYFRDPDGRRVGVSSYPL